MTNTREQLLVPHQPGHQHNPDRKLSPKFLTRKCQNMQFPDLAAKFKELNDCTKHNFLTFFSLGEFDVSCVNGDNVFQLLEIAACLGNDRLLSICEDVCLQNMYPQNAFSMFNMATTYDLKRLRFEAVKHIELNIEDICESDEVQCMGANDLFDLLRKSNIKNSPFAMKAVEHWFVYEKDPRQNHYRNMVEYLQQIQSRFRPLENLNQSNKVYQLLFRVGKSKKSSLKVHVYEPSKNLQRKFKLKECKNVGADFAACCSQDSEHDDPHIYMSGGERGPHKVYHCDIILNKRKKCSKKLNYGRAKHCMAAVGRSVYVIGGTHKGEVVSEIEEFTTKRHSWKLVGELCHPVHSAACVVYDNELLVFGGVLADGTTTTVIQKFSPQTGESVVMGHLPFGASNTKAVVHNSSVFIAFEDGQFVCYEPYFAITKPCAQLPVGCRDFAMFSERDGVYVAGGFSDKKGKLSDIYRYTLDLDTWQRAETGLISPMYTTCCCAVKVPPTFNLVPFLDCC